jgi:hypothetical protein
MWTQNQWREKSLNIQNENKLVNIIIMTKLIEQLIVNVCMTRIELRISEYEKITKRGFQIRLPV